MLRSILGSAKSIFTNRLFSPSRNFTPLNHMKSFFFVFLSISLLGGTEFLHGQPAALAAKRLPAPAAYAVARQDGNSRAWERTMYELGPQGQVVPKKHHVTELATGLNYLSNGQWVESKEEIDVLPQGGVAATHGQHQAYFPADIDQGKIKVVTPDGLQLQSRPLGIFYDDGHHTVLIGLLTNSIGVLVSSNQVIYPDAFAGLRADLRYTYRKSGFEQDIVLLAQPPAPAAFGLDPAKTRLQVMTEFFNAPNPGQVVAPVNRESGLSDTTLRFGQMKMMQGKAFSIGSPNSNLPASNSKTPVYKSWLRAAGRTFLMEELPVAGLAAQLAQLPLPASVSVNTANSLLDRVSATRLLPPVQTAQAGAGTGQLARADLKYQSGVVLDYVEMNADQDNFTFQGDTTYLVDGAFVSTGTNTFEGGTVIKADVNGEIDIDPGGIIVCQTTAYRPAVFTSVNDDSVGESMADSGDPYYTGIPNSGDVSTSLYLECPDPVFNHVRFNYAATAIFISFDDYADVSLNDAQFINCSYCVLSSQNVFLNNALVSDGQFVCDAGSLTANNVTFNNLSYGVIYCNPASFTNCIFAGVTNMAWEWAGDVPVDGSGDYAVAGGNNGFYNSPAFGTGQVTDGSNPFAAAGGGNCYLADNTFRDAGTANLDPDLLAELHTTTTYAPQDGNYLDTDPPDLGYHYPLACPVVAQQPASQTAFAGQTGMFGVSISGYGTFSYQWLFDGTAIVASNLITTVAGNYYSLGWGYAGDGGPATNAALAFPNDVTLDGAGNLYIDDSENNVIRKVDASGNITTVAGSYGLGGNYSGDGGAATNAALNSPSSVAVDGSGNLYIADTWNAVIRKVDTNGMITTVAGNDNLDWGYSGDGGPATNATLNLPSGVAVDGSGNVYIADEYNSVIRKVDTNGYIWTVAGNGGYGYSGDGGMATNATLNSPCSVAVDAAGNLYIADGGNNDIRKVDTGGIITTVAGNYGLGGSYSGDGGAATNAALACPNDVMADSAGNLYIADSGNSVIRKVDAGGMITTVAGNNILSGGYSGDGGLAINAAMYYPNGVTVDGAGNLYIADTENSVIRKVAYSAYSVDEDGTLAINGAQAGQAGDYQVVVSNSFFTDDCLTSSVAVLTVDPDIIGFSIEATNDYVNHTNVSVQLDITAGLPSYYAVLVNNQTATNWLSFSTTNLSVNLGTTDGVYALNVGLKGFATNAVQTWENYSFTVDRVAPVVVITNPVSGTVIQSLIQLEGYASKSLGGLFFDVSNAVGVVSNQQGFVTDQYYDTNLWKLTTNFFQCFDITLTNGLNQITLHATDLAGNTTTVSTNFTVNYATATNPVLALTWPTNGMQICGGSFTLRGTVDDPSATVSATITDTNGDVNTVSGEVERTGVLWVENLPLAGGTNWLVLSVTNSAGYLSAESITVVKSGMTLTLTNIDGDLWNPTVNVSGLISDAGYSVSVNGVPGTNHGNGTWSAANVPVSSGGVASFDISASSGGGGYTDGSLNTNKPDRLYVESYRQNLDTSEYYGYTSWWTDDTNQPSAYWTEEWDTNHYDQHWTNALGGGGSSLMQRIVLEADPYYNFTDVAAEQMSWPGTNWENVYDLDGTGIFSGNDCGTTPTNVPVDIGPPFSYGSYGFVAENCDESDPQVTSWFGFDQHDFGPGWEADYDNQTYVRHAETKMALLTGGMALPHRQNLFCISGWAKDVEAVNGKRAQPPYMLIEYGSGTPLGNEPYLPYATTAIGSLGNLKSDGNLWVVLPDGATPYDVTVHVGRPFYIFNVSEQKYKLQIQVNDAAILDPDCVVSNANYCVGQYLTFTAGFDPALPETPEYAPVRWAFTGTYYNDGSNAVPGETYPTCSSNYFANIGKLSNPSTTAWWVSGGTNANIPAIYNASFGEGLTFANGQYLAVATHGLFNMYRPTATISPVMSSVTLFFRTNVFLLQFGVFTNDINGITFSNTVAYPTNFQGSTEWIQIAFTNDRSMQDFFATNHIRIHNGSAPFLDTEDPYTSKLDDGTAVDSPGQGIGLLITNVVAADSFQMTMMFDPPGGGMRVPLKSVNWSWNGNAHTTNGLDGWVVSGSGNVNSNYDTESYPQWKSNTTNASWNPPLP